MAVGSDAVTFTATASDNVGVSSVNFLVDNGTIQGTVQKTPNTGSFSLAIPLNFITVGNHTVAAIASDAAGNTTTSAVVSFNVPNPSGGGTGTGSDTTPPTVSATAVDGNFGLVKLTTIATDNVRIDTVSFLVDGTPSGFRASPAYLSTDPDNQYFTRYDTSGLASGQHHLVARVTDRAFNMTDSVDVVFNVDATAGLFETEPNETIATATVVSRNQRQIAGTMKTVITMVDMSQILQPDKDYYQINLAAGETVSIDMLSGAGFFLELEDANGVSLTNTPAYLASDVVNISYTNGSAARVAYIRLTSIPFDFTPRDQYKLSLSYR